MSPNSSVSDVTSFGLDDRDSFTVRGRNFSLRGRVQTGSGAHPATSPEVPVLLFVRMKRVDHVYLLPPSSTKI